MSVFAIFCWFVLLLCIVLAAWGVGYDMGSTERERMRRLGTLPPHDRTTERAGSVVEFKRRLAARGLVDKDFA